MTNKLPPQFVDRVSRILTSSDRTSSDPKTIKEMLGSAYTELGIQFVSDSKSIETVQFTLYNTNFKLHKTEKVFEALGQPFAVWQITNDRNFDWVELDLRHRTEPTIAERFQEAIAEYVVNFAEPYFDRAAREAAQETEQLLRLQKIYLKDLEARIAEAKSKLWQWEGQIALYRWQWQRGVAVSENGDRVPDYQTAYALTDTPDDEGYVLTITPNNELGTREIRFDPHHHATVTRLSVTSIDQLPSEFRVTEHLRVDAWEHQKLLGYTATDGDRLEPQWDDSTIVLDEVPKNLIHYRDWQKISSFHKLGTLPVPWLRDLICQF